MGGRWLIPPPVVKFPSPRPLGDILQLWARRRPTLLKALTKFVIYIDEHATDEEIASLDVLLTHAIKKDG